MMSPGLAWFRAACRSLPALTLMTCPPTGGAYVVSRNSWGRRWAKAVDGAPTAASNAQIAAANGALRRRRGTVQLSITWRSHQERSTEAPPGGVSEPAGIGPSPQTATLRQAGCQESKVPRRQRNAAGNRWLPGHSRARVGAMERTLLWFRCEGFVHSQQAAYLNKWVAHTPATGN